MRKVDITDKGRILEFLTNPGKALRQDPKYYWEDEVVRIIVEIDPLSHIPELEAQIERRKLMIKALRMGISWESVCEADTDKLIRLTNQ